MNDKIILTDVDGVLLCWEDSFKRFLASKNIHTVELYKDHYNLCLRYNLTEDQVDKYCEEHCSTEDIGNLPSIYDSVEGIRTLSKAGYRFVAITSFSDDQDAIQKREKNLKSLFGDVFLSVIGLPIKSSKKPALSLWEDTGLWWIEDHLQNARDGASLGLRTILVDEDHNKDSEKETYIRVSNINPWHQICDLILGNNTYVNKEEALLNAN